MAVMVRVGDFPELTYLCWHLDREATLSEAEALQIYERNWRHVGELGADERRFVQHLVDTHGEGIALV